MRLLLVVLTLVGWVLFPAAPADAHTDSYCGHGVHWHWTSRSEWVESWTDRYGRHRHTVYTRTGLTGTSIGYPVC